MGRKKRVHHRQYRPDSTGMNDERQLLVDNSQDKRRNVGRIVAVGVTLFRQLPQLLEMIEAYIELKPELVFALTTKHRGVISNGGELKCIQPRFLRYVKAVPTQFLK